MSKTFRLTESKSLAFRADVQNVLNHPQPGGPSLTINTPATPFGQITNEAGGRSFQGQLRLNF